MLQGLFTKGRARGGIVALLFGSLAACGGVGGHGSMPPESNLVSSTPASPSPAPDATPAPTNVLVTVVVPQAAAQPQGSARKPRYVSVGTKSIALTFTPPTGSPTTVDQNLTTTSPGCVVSYPNVTCTIKIALTPGPYTASATTYSGALVNGVPSGSPLSANASLAFTVLQGHVTAVDLPLAGIPTVLTYAVVPAALFGGTAPSALSVGRCAKSSAGYLTVNVADAAGYSIAGSGSATLGFTSTLQSAGTFSVATPRPQTPNEYPIVATAYPAPGSPFDLTITGTPAAGSGTSPITLALVGTFDTNACAAALVTSSLGYPTGLATDAAGNAYGLERNLSTNATSLVKVTPAGVVTVVASLASYQSPSGLTADSGGNLYFASASGVFMVSNAGTVTPIAPGLSSIGIARDGSGAIYTVSTSGGSVIRIDPSLSQSAYAQLPGYVPTQEHMAFDSLGNLYVTTSLTMSGDTIVKITPQGPVAIFATGLQTLTGLTVGANDTVFALIATASQFGTTETISTIGTGGSASPYLQTTVFTSGTYGLVTNPNGGFYTHAGTVFALN